MVITRHLSNQQLIDLQLASDEQALQSTRAALAEWADHAGQQPEYFWYRQQAQIRERIAASQRRARRLFLSLAWSSALALVIAAAALLRSGPGPAPAPPHQASVDPDHQLLLEVERVMRSDGPASLEPAGLLIQEVSQNASPDSASQAYDKEKSHEN